VTLRCGGSTESLGEAGDKKLLVNATCT